jgi:hypothetical protein
MSGTDGARPQNTILDFLGLTIDTDTLRKRNAGQLINLGLWVQQRQQASLFETEKSKILNFFIIYLVENYG